MLDLFPAGLENDGVAIANLFQLLADHHINVDMISKQTYGDNKCTISFSCTDAQARDLDRAIENHEILSEVAVEKQPNLSILSLVGVGMATATELQARFSHSCKGRDHLLPDHYFGNLYIRDCEQR